MADEEDSKADPWEDYALLHNGLSWVPESLSVEQEQAILKNFQQEKKEFQLKVHAARIESSVRGMVIGLAIGDTLGGAKGNFPAGGPLRAGVSTQLACFTMEGIIRAMVRGDAKGICHPPSVVCHAYCRWAALQGIERDRMQRRWASTTSSWPDGWISKVLALAERRGSAPATVTALSTIGPSGDPRPTGSRGCHALTRTLPVAAAAIRGDETYWIRQAREIAALTHGDPLAQAATAHATALVKYCLDGERVHSGLEAGLAALSGVDRDTTDADVGRLEAVYRQALAHPGDSARLKQFAPDSTAPSALLGGLYAAASFPDGADFDAALRFAAGAPDGDSAACVTGALLGAAHGVEALPVELVSRHELAWVLDTLARDLLLQATQSPAGSWGVTGWDPRWSDRYPGG